MRPIRWLSALVLAIAVACAPAATALAAPASLSGTAAGCTTSAPQGSCGPYSYRPISNSNGYNSYVGQNCWADPSCRQTLTVTDPGTWSVTSTEPARNTGVRTYPDVQQLFSDWCGRDGTGRFSISQSYSGRWSSYSSVQSECVMCSIASDSGCA